MKVAADVAEHTFRAMFNDRLGNMQFLVQSPEDVVLETLRSWAQQRNPQAALDGRRTSGLLLQECSDLLTDLTSVRDAFNEEASWPYIHKVMFVFLALVHWCSC